MNRVIFLSVLLVSLVAWPVQAAIPVVYTNENFFTSKHDAPVSFERDAFGNFSGVTESGKLFTQRPVVTDIQVRLHRFAIDEAYFYVSSLGIILADSDTTALSIYLARAGWDEEVA